MISPLLCGGVMKSLIMSIESSILTRITTYVAENKILTALEAEASRNMADEANSVEINDMKYNGKEPKINMVISDHKEVVETFEENSKLQRLDCIYDDEPLGIEKYPLDSTQRMQAQDLLEEIDLGDGSVKMPTVERVFYH